MLKSSLIFTYFFLISIYCFGQEKEIFIGPGPHLNQMQRLFIYDGFPITTIKSNMIINPDQIETVSIEADTIFNDSGVALYKGVVILTSKDSVNVGLKQILKETDFWIYDNPLGLIEINGENQKWDSITWSRLSKLNHENIISVEVIESKDFAEENKGKIKLMIKD